MTTVTTLLKKVRSCTLCAEHLPLGARPVLQLNPKARILVAGQAPGRKVHESGVPFADASGDRLREWLGLSAEMFYNPKYVAILPMGFCYPGTGKSGDLPPRPECATAWRQQCLAQLPELKLTLVIGQYALAYHLPDHSASVTNAVLSWRDHWPQVVPLPHPSPRNNIWLSKNPWFANELLPLLRQRVAELLRYA
jgi:uracil-DNA glycosylase